MLAIEDIHWADRSTLDFLGFLVANARRERLAAGVQLSHRRAPPPPSAACVPRPARAPPGGASGSSCGGSRAAELAAQIAAILGDGAGPRVVGRLLRRTEGNAFFTEELLAAAGEGTGLPASLRDALMLRIDALPPAAQHLVRLAAVHGRPVTHRLLAAATELVPEEELHAALREAVARHVLVRRDVDTYALRHALLAEALDADLLPGERTRLHLALARAIEGDPTLASRDGRAAAELSAHWLGAHRLPEALAAAVRAGDEAEEVYAFAEASHHFLRALELWQRVEDADERAGMDEAALYARAAEGAHLGGEGPVAIRLVQGGDREVDAAADPYARPCSASASATTSSWSPATSRAPSARTRRPSTCCPASEPGPSSRVCSPRSRRSTCCAGGRPSRLQRASGRSRSPAGPALGPRRRTRSTRWAQPSPSSATGRPGSGTCAETLRISEELGDLDGLARAYLNLSEMVDQDGRIEEAAEIVLDGRAPYRRAGSARPGPSARGPGGQPPVHPRSTGRGSASDRAGHSSCRIPSQRSSNAAREPRSRSTGVALPRPSS